MQKEQKEIYFVTGLDLESLSKNPALEAFRNKDIEVLYLIDPLDEFVIDHLRSFEGKNFKMVESADIKLDSDQTQEHDDEYKKNLDSFSAYLKTIYGDKVSDVKISKRLVESPCILVHPSDGPSPQMERVMKMVNKEYQSAKKTFEFNPDNELIKEMVRIHKKNPVSLELKSLSLQMLDNQLLREGILDDIDRIVPQIQDIMIQAAKKLS